MFKRKSPAIVLIDDDPFALALTAKVVGHLMNKKHIRTFTSAKDAIAFLCAGIAVRQPGQAVPGLILSDLNMPGMDGFGFLDEFAKLSPAICDRYKLYILSATRDEGEQRKLFEKICFAGFCPKPLTVEKLQQILKETGHR